MATTETVLEAILDIGHPATPGEIATQLGEEANRIHQILYKAKRRGDVRVTAGGCYYPPGVTPRLLTPEEEERLQEPRQAVAWGGGE